MFVGGGHWACQEGAGEALERRWEGVLELGQGSLYPQTTMRLTEQQRIALKRAAQQCFEPDVVLRLFGSRVDDRRRGGDIDLLIETQLTDPEMIARAHTRFLSQVYVQLGEQKVDVLIDYPTRHIDSAIYAEARQTGVVL